MIIQAQLSSTVLAGRLGAHIAKRVHFERSFPTYEIPPGCVMVKVPSPAPMVWRLIPDGESTPNADKPAKKVTR
jgi:hypothetical protein